jgi:integrase
VKTKPISVAKQAMAAQPGVHSVTGAAGLYLKKGENGTGSWFYRYRHGKDAGGRNVRREMGLGSIGEVTLADARKKAKELAVQRANGCDPIEARRKERADKLTQARIEAKKVTFAQAARSHLEAHAPSWKHRHARASWWNPIRNYALPIISDLLLDEIQIEHVVAVMRPAEKANAPEVARRVRARIETVLDAATAKGQRDVTRLNPASARLIAKVHPSKRRGERKHYRAVPLDSAPEIFRRLRDRAETSTPIAAWLFMIATAARPSEALKARWDEIDLVQKLWTIPAARMKNDKPHAVPLSSIALAALERQACVRAGDAVFPGPRGVHPSYRTFVDAAMKAGVDAGAPHSWRSIFKDWAGDYGRIDRDLAEAALAHSLGATEASYRRRTAVEARRPVMEAYAAWLLDEGANVIAFPPRAG